MAKNTIEAQNLLKQAVKSEIDGRRFYLYLAGKASNDEAKRKLTNLADDEARHEKALLGIYKKVYGEVLTGLPEKGISVLSKFFENPEGREEMSEMQYIDLAIEAELAATNFYKAESEKATSEEFRKIYETMAVEEFCHYELLQAEKSALSGDYYWFSFGDTTPMED
jgi:rubrerythrin